MEHIQFTINGKQYFVGSDVDSNLTLVDFIRRRANLLGTKFMCLEAGCGACIVSVVKSPGDAPTAVNSCMVTILSCHNWDITTIEKLGNRLDGYHPIQKTLAMHNGAQCGHCSPGWVMAMYSLLESKKDMTMLDIEKSFGSNICRCTGYRPIMDAFKTFATDASKSKEITDIEDLVICKRSGTICNKNKCDDDDWCVVTKNDTVGDSVPRIVLTDGNIWYRPQTISDIFDIFSKENFNNIDSYMLVSGNTGKGAFPIDDYPPILIDVSQVEALKGHIIDQNLKIGAGTTLTELLDIFEYLSKTETNFEYLKTLHEHLSLVAHIAVRNLGSIGGNLMLKHRHNDFPSDIYLLLSTVGAQISILHKPNVKQVLTMEQFLKVDMINKIILNVLLPPFNEEYKIVTYKIMPRAQNAIAIVNAGFLYKYNNVDKKVILSRIAYGGLSPSFTRAKSTENCLIGKSIFSNETLQSALKILGAELEVQNCLPKSSAVYRKQLALALFYKSLLSLCPETILSSRFRSGATKLGMTRPVSTGQQNYETKPYQYPLTQPIPKLDALILCSGESSYSEDQPTYANEVFAALVMSTVPTGTIVSIDATEALSQPGAIAFYSAKDIPGLNSFTPAEDAFGFTNEEVFSSGEIKYFNQPIGVVAAETKHIAEKIAKMIKVEYCNIQRPVIDVKEAKKDPKRNFIFGQIDAKSKGNNVFKTIKGEVTYRAQCHFTMETIVSISKPTEEGLEIFASSQWLDALQTMVARALNINQNRVDVYNRRLGGGFGLKISRTTLASVAGSLVTYKLNRPCRIIMPLTHVTRALGKRFPCSCDYDVSVDSQGLIQRLDLNLYEDNGFAVNEKLQQLAIHNYNNCYDGSNWNYKNISTITDTAKNTWFRAPGHLENVSVVEEIMERISYELSLDVIDVRMKNLDPNTASDAIEIINTLKQSSEYDKRKVAVQKFNSENRWKKRGLGVSLLKWSTDVTRNFDVQLSVFKGDGSIIITHGGIEMGQGINTKAIQICAFLLQVPINKIQVKPNSTIVAANAAVSGGSLTTQYVSLGVHKCCLELIKRLAPIKKQMNNPTWEELILKAFEMDVNLSVHEFVGAKDKIDFYLYGMTVAEVEIDVLTGERQVLRVDILEDVGQSPSPKLDVGQIEGAFVQAMGYWLTEHMVYDPKTGELLTDRTWNYHVPLALDIPQDIRVSFRKNSYSSELILGSKYTGEPPFCMAVAVPHAIRQAIASARIECGIPATSWFDIDGTYTLERVFMASANKTTDYKFS